MTRTLPEFPFHLDLGAFLSRESHDLKTPFSHIIGFSRFILQGQDGPLTDSQREDMTIVYHSGVRALFLISNLIEAARISRGEKEPTLAEIQVNPFIEQTVANWKRSNPARQVQFETHVSVASPTLHADEAQLCQVVSSLVSCVVEFTKGAAKVCLDVAEEPGWVVMTIQSVGHKSPSQSELDLEMLGYICRAYIEQHGGEIRTREETDDGAVICFALPKRSGVEQTA